MTTRAVDRLIGRVLQIFAFFLPFALLGMRLGDYIFSVATFFVLLLNFLILLRGRFLKKPLAFFALFWIWCFLTAASRYPLSSYGFSLLALGAMLLPLCARIPESVDGGSVMRALVNGAIASFVLAGYEIGVNFGLPPLTEITSIGLWGTSVPQESVYFGIYRVKSGETEPAHYAHYLVLVYAIIDLADRRGYEVQHPHLMKGTLVFFLLATISLSGLVLFITYQTSVFVWEWRERILQRITSVWFWVGSPFIFVFAVVVWQQVGGDISKYAIFTFGRLEEAITAIQLGLVSGSEASRARSATIVFEYWASHDWLQTFAGEGYANYENWLEQTFAHTGNELGSSFARGSMQNVFSVVGISTGMIGMSLYLGFIGSVTLRKRASVPLGLVTLWLVYHFATGYLVTYRLWWPILLGALIFRSQGEMRFSEREARVHH